MAISCSPASLAYHLQLKATVIMLPNVLITKLQTHAKVYSSNVYCLCIAMLTIIL